MPLNRRRSPPVFENPSMASFALTPRYSHGTEKKRVIAIVLPILVGQGCEEQWQVYARHGSQNEKFALCGCFKTIGFDCLENFKDGLSLCVSRLFSRELSELAISSLDFNDILVNNVALSQQLKLGETVDVSASIQQSSTIHRNRYDNSSWKSSVDLNRLGGGAKLTPNSSSMDSPLSVDSSTGSSPTFSIFNTSCAAALLTGLRKSYNSTPSSDIVSSPASTPPSSDRRHPSLREDKSTSSQSVIMDSSSDQRNQRKQNCSDYYSLPLKRRRDEIRALEERRRLDHVATTTIDVLHKTLENAVQSRFARRCFDILADASDVGVGVDPTRSEFQSFQLGMGSSGVGNSDLSYFSVSSVSGYGGVGKGTSMVPSVFPVTGSFPFPAPIMPTKTLQAISTIYFDEPCPQCPQTVLPVGQNSLTLNVGVQIGGGDDDWVVPFLSSYEVFENSSDLGDLLEDLS